VSLGSAQVGLRRPDVGTDGIAVDRAGWQLEATGLEPRKYDMTAYAWSIRTHRFEDARTVIVFGRASSERLAAAFNRAGS
jgi:hypothetical protein